MAVRDSANRAPGTGDGGVGRVDLKTIERRRKTGWRYAIALAVFLVSFAVRYWLDAWLPLDRGFIVWLPAVMLTTFFAGLGPGMLVALLSGLTGWYFFIPPFYAFEINPDNEVVVAAYFLAAAVGIALIYFPGRALNRLEAEKAKAEVFARQRELMFEANPNGNIVVDQAGRIFMANTHLMKLFGYSREELIGQPVEMLVPTRFRGHHEALRAEFSAQPSNRAMGAGRDLYGRRKDGNEFLVEIGLSPFDYDNRKMVLATVIDITERKRAEENLNLALGEAERERTRAEIFARQCDTMFTELQHRVSNNLQLVSGLLILERAHVSDEHAKRALTEAALRLALIGKLHRKLYNPVGDAVDFGVFLKEVCDDILQAWGARNIECLVKSAELTLPVKKSIPIALVATELISNALEHGFAGRHRGRINVDLQRDGDSAIVLTVADDGDGLPPGFDATTAKSLGLRIVRRLTRQLGGRFEIVDGKGATCRLIIPVSVGAVTAGSPDRGTPES